jgi:hypothetical protein
MVDNSNPISAWVELQGGHTLDCTGIESDHAQYRVVGFNNEIVIRDYRLTPLEAIRQAWSMGDATQFVHVFNMPAKVIISDNAQLPIMIDLTDTSENDPVYRLWIAVGITKSIPVFDYLFERIAAVEGEDHFAFVALYRREYRSELATLPLFSHSRSCQTPI